MIWLCGRLVCVDTFKVTAIEGFLWLCVLYTYSYFPSHLSSHQTHMVAKESTETLTGSARAWLSEQYAALAHYTHMITWPFPQWMSLIRSHWRSHWVCNCFPLGETLTAIELHLTAESADECSLSAEWSGLILLWVVMELLKIPKPPDQFQGEGDASCVFFFSVKETAGQEFICLLIHWSDTRH